MNLFTSFRFITFFLVICTVFSCKTDPKTEEGQTNKDQAKAVTIAFQSEPQGLTPLLFNSGTSSDIQWYMFSTLLFFDFDNPTKYLPVLATKVPEPIKITEGEDKGGLKIDFELRKDAVWGDGKSITAEDYLFSMKSIMNPNCRQAGAWRANLNFIKDVRIDKNNPKKFTIITNQVHMNAVINTGGLVIIPKHIYDPKRILDKYELTELIAKEKEFVGNEELIDASMMFENADYSQGKKPIPGSGPYEFQMWDKGVQLVLKSKKDWWGDNYVGESDYFKANRPELITYKIIPDLNTRIGKLKTEEVDILPRISQLAFKELNENEAVKENYNLYHPSFGLFYYLAMNNQNKILKDKSVRKALAHLVDLEKQIDVVMHGYGKQGVGPIFSKKSYFNKGLKPVKFDPAYSAKLLKEAGWKDSDGNGILDKKVDGVQTEFDLTIYIASTSIAGKKICQLLQEEAKKIGIKIELEEKAHNRVSTENLQTGDFDIYPSGSRSAPLLTDLSQSWHSSSFPPNGNNYSRFANEDVDRLIDAIKIETNIAKRNELYMEVQNVIYEEQPVIFLFEVEEGLAIHKKFKDPKIVSFRPGFFMTFLEPSSQK